MLHYYKYRYQLFKYELKSMSKQFQQFTMMFLVLFYMAVPGVIAGLFLGLGKVAENASVQVAMGYLILQSLQISVVKKAITGSNHRMFARSIVNHPMHHYLADGVLLLFSHILALCSLILMFSMGVTNLLQAPYFVLFFFMQLYLGGLLLVKPHACVLTLLVGVIMLLLGFDFNTYFFALLLVSFGFCFAPKFTFSNTFTLHTSYHFWISYFLAYHWAITWRGCLSILVIWAMYIIKQERPDLLHWYTVFCIALNQLWWSTLCIETAKHLKKTTCFWRNIHWQDKVMRSQYMIVFTLNCVFAMLSFTVLQFSLYGFLVILSSPLLLYLAFNKAKYTAVAWGVSTTVVIVLKVLLAK
jgi:hypothetical protein